VSAPRGHHLVPQTYQRGFARRHGKIWQVRVINRSTGAQRLSNVADTFKRRDWNTIVDADGTKDFAIEQLLADLVDSPAAPALEALRADRYPLDDGQREHLARFISAQLTRGRHIRENLEKFMIETGRRVVSLAAQHYTDEHWIRAIGEVPSAETRAALLHSERHFDLKPTNAGMLDALLSTVDDIAGPLLGRSWTLVRFAEPCLLTSEHPVIYANHTGSRLGYGVATADQIYLPVSPTHGLVLSHPWAGWPDALVNGTPELARRLNWAVLAFPTSDELLAHPDVQCHPLPGAAVLAAAASHWPWPAAEHSGARMPDWWQRFIGHAA